MSRNYNRGLRPINIADKAQATRALANRLLIIMQEHIGRENKLSQEALFRKLFHTTMDLEHSFSHWGWWEFTKKAMHYCRLYTKCFIVAIKDGRHEYSYCVVKDYRDLQDYEDLLTDSIKSMKKMINKGEKAVEERWYREVWALSQPKSKQIENKSQKK